MRATRLAAAAAALLAAAAVLVLALDVSRWRETMRADDLRYAAASGTSPRWDTRELVPFGLTRRLLGVDDDRELRRAVLGYRTVTRSGPTLDKAGARRARGEVEVALSTVASRSTGAHASQAENLLGILAFADATSRGALGRSAPVERSVTAFETAVRLDRGNEAAKDNLELILRLLKAEGVRAGNGPAPAGPGTGRRGAGGGTPGRGY